MNCDLLTINLTGHFLDIAAGLALHGSCINRRPDFFWQSHSELVTNNDRNESLHSESICINITICKVSLRNTKRCYWPSDFHFSWQTVANIDLGHGISVQGWDNNVTRGFERTRVSDTTDFQSSFSAWLQISVRDEEPQTAFSCLQTCELFARGSWESGCRLKFNFFWEFHIEIAGRGNHILNYKLKWVSVQVGVVCRITNHDWADWGDGSWFCNVTWVRNTLINIVVPTTILVNDKVLGCHFKVSSISSWNLILDIFNQ